MDMNSILQNAFEKAKTLPDNRQDEVGQMLLAMMEQDQSGLQLSADQQVEVRLRLAKPTELVPEAEMAAFFRKLIG
jgi:hypothetical protein